MVEEELDESLQAWFRDTQSDIQLVVHSVAKQEILDLLRTGTKRQTLKDHIARLFNIDGAIEE